MRSDIDLMTAEVVDWISPLIPDENRNPFNTSIKLVEETSELLHALHTGEGNVGHELADIMILTLDIAHLTGVDIVEEFWRKMKINRKRVWNEKNGSLHHERDNDAHSDR
jgi:NTP pyrophosphatase (non-canonical NTP hydrolase)